MGNQLINLVRPRWIKFWKYTQPHSRSTSLFFYYFNPSHWEQVWRAVKPRLPPMWSWLIPDSTLHVA